MLRVLERGPASGPELQAHLGVSQPTLSRLVGRVRRVLPFGRARRRRYALRRPIGSLRGALPVFEVMPTGEVREAFGLQPIAPDRFVVEGPGLRATVFDDLPWFLQDLRPAGFLGRTVTRSLPPGWLPRDLRMWSAEHTLEYAARFGWNLPGAFLVGEDSVQLRGDHLDAPPDVVVASERDETYGARAASVLAHGDAGSSAAGEQPKFLATRRDATHDVPVLVKFSPRRDHPASIRTADLLVAEHLALEVLRSVGHPAAASTLVESDERMFLEVERFDRAPGGGRRSTVTLQFVDAEFVGSDLSRWSTSTAELAQLGLIDAETHRRTRFREQFGDWIANTDQHFGNLAFHLDGVKIVGLTPAYDVNPAAYVPIRGDVPEIDPAVRVARPSNRDIASEARVAAIELWRRVSTDDRVSTAFRAIARERITRLERLRVDP
ncbi:MAG: HipA domain-containing protein [Myxococcota bacterium]